MLSKNNTLKVAKILFDNKLNGRRNGFQVYLPIYP